MIAPIDELAGRTRRVGTCYKFAPDSPGFAMDSDSTGMGVNTVEMSATAIISTATVDRENDILMPRGMRVENYAKNPAVMWDHGLGSITVPIATSEDRQGNLAIAISDSAVMATSYFSNRSLISEQIFNLIEDKIVRATSVRGEPIKAFTRRDEETRELGLVLEEWDLVEWSWTAIGVNPEAVAKSLSDNRLAGRQIDQDIVKSLKPFAAPLKTFGKGIDLMIDEKKPEEEETVKMEVPAEEEEVVEKMEPVDPAGVEEAIEDELEKMDDGEEVEDDSPLGSQVLRAVHTSMKDMLAQVDTAMGPLEQPEIKEFLHEAVEQMTAKMAEVEGLHGKAYPKSNALSKAEEEAEDDKTEDDQLKSWLRSGRNNGLQLAGLANRLKSMTRSKSLSRSERRTLSATVAHLGRISRDARTVEPGDAALHALKKEFQALGKQLASATPVN